MIKVLICDDQLTVCDGLQAILEADPDIKVVGIAENGEQALLLAASTKPDVALMDLNMPGMNGVQATRKLNFVHPEIKVLVLTTYSDDDWVFDAIQAGASGFLLKGTPRAQLVAAIKGTAAGKAHIDPAVGGKLLAKLAQQSIPKRTPLSETLSPRELDVLSLLARGQTNEEIANSLFLSEGTVRNYISTILQKLDVTDRTQAALLAMKNGL